MQLQPFQQLRSDALRLIMVGALMPLLYLPAQVLAADTPPEVPCTTFSILFARLKGDLRTFAVGAAAIDRLGPGDKVLIAESCSHHALEDDIGRIKIPRWLRQYAGADVQIDVFAGRDFPDNLSEYKP